MTQDEADTHAEGMLIFLKNKFQPAEAMFVLTALAALALRATSPGGPGQLEKSCELFLTGVVSQLQGRMRG